MEQWVISDTHFGHENIIQYCARPFANAREMDQKLIENWNAVVQPQDHIKHLGDVTMARGGRIQKEEFVKLIRSLNGHKRLFLGNHDHFPIQTYLDAGFEKIYATWRDDDRILWSHIPIHPLSMGTAIANCHGHIHNNQSKDFADFGPVLFPVSNKEARAWGRKVEPATVKPYINLCVEVTDYKPIHLDEVKARIKKESERGKNTGV